MMDAETDEQLLERFVESGDVTLLDALVRRNIGKIRGAIYAMVLNHADADDLTQEVFLKAFDKLEGYDGCARFSTWLYRIAMNRSKDFLRRKNRNPVDLPGEVPEKQDGASGPDRRMMAAELNAEVSAALAALSPPLRSAIVLTAIQGLSAREAAQIEECVTATMHWRVHQARKMLTQRLDRDGYGSAKKRTGTTT